MMFGDLMFRFNYKAELMKNLSQEAKIINVFNRTVMQGERGAVATVVLPPVKGEWSILSWGRVCKQLIIIILFTNTLHCPKCL